MKLIVYSQLFQKLIDIKHTIDYTSYKHSKVTKLYLLPKNWLLKDIQKI